MNNFDILNIVPLMKPKNFKANVQRIYNNGGTNRFSHQFKKKPRQFEVQF
jgi:hypothetical protein